MARPPASTTGKDRKLPSSAAAIAEMTTSVSVLMSSPEYGVIKIPANAARAPPKDQVANASMSGDQASEDAARWFSAAARIASPAVAYLLNAYRPAVTAIAMTTMISRSSERTMPLVMWIGFCGRTGSTDSEAEPHRKVATAWRTRSTPRVAITLVRGAALRSGRMISGWTSPASRPITATEISIAGRTPRPWFPRSSTL